MGLLKRCLQLFHPYHYSNKKLVLLLLCANYLSWISPGQAFTQLPVNIQNPVLPGVADAGVLKFNGEYYIGGVFTNGSFYKSKDLVKWEGPVHVFSMKNDWTNGPSAGDNQIHANDINYINGVFHMYWSVNYWGKDRNVIHIGHATSTGITGPYQEPVKETWMENRIDPELFVDDDGKLYMYMVKFTDGNTIWVRPMKDPLSFSGEPRYVFASLPNTWETLDNRVAEGPFVIKYRNKYYMMYNANHTSPGWGNYALGVAEADSPLDFNHGNKYPFPLVKSNQVDVEDEFVDILKYAGQETGVFEYTEDVPGEHWAKPGYDAKDWKKGKAGFGSAVIKNSTTRKLLTTWNTPQIWLRRTFRIDKKNTGNLMLRINHDGDSEVFLNGRLIYGKKGRSYTTWNFDKDADALLKDGENILAIHSSRGTRSGFLDISLFDMKTETGDDILFSPGQPNIVRGPNGFEWWLVYMANKNGDNRGQYINRVEFFNKTIFVDGITGSHTKGYHPKPALPAFSDLFAEAENDQFQNRWKTLGGEWMVKDGELWQTNKTTSAAFVKTIPATHYLFESGIKFRDSTGVKAGLIAWWKDEKNWLYVLLDPANKTWSYLINEAGVQKTIVHMLPPGFKFNVYHTISVQKNSGNFMLRIDDLPAPGDPLVKTTFVEKGIPGLYTDGGSLAFDGVLYTIGWDEFDGTITGWGPSPGEQAPKSSWEGSKEGMIQQQPGGELAVFKGDSLESYEITAQVSAEGHTGSAGLYPVYVNANNYIKAVFDFKEGKFVISGKTPGKDLKPKELLLQRSRDYYADMKYTDFFEKHFTFGMPVSINAVKLSKIPLSKPDTMIEDMYKKMSVFYKRKGEWYPINEYQQSPDLHPAFNKITFNTIEAEALKFVNKGADDQNFYLNKVWVDEVSRQSYNLRVVKLKEELIFIVDGKELYRMKYNAVASRVGLVTNNTKAGFNGITLMHLP